MDYDHMFNKSACPVDSEKWKEAEVAFGAFDPMALMAAWQSTEINDEKKRELFEDAAHMLAIHVDCYTGLLRAPVDRSHGYGLNQAIVITHAIMETPNDHSASILMDQNWDTVDLYQNPVDLVV